MEGAGGGGARCGWQEPKGGVLIKASCGICERDRHADGGAFRAGHPPPPSHWAGEQLTSPRRGRESSSPSSGQPAREQERMSGPVSQPIYSLEVMSAEHEGPWQSGFLFLPPPPLHMGGLPCNSACNSVFCSYPLARSCEPSTHLCLRHQQGHQCNLDEELHGEIGRAHV